MPPVEAASPSEVEQTAGWRAGRQPVGRTGAGQVDFAGRFHAVSILYQRGSFAKSLSFWACVVGSRLVTMMKILPRFTFGMGDRFGHEGEAQLSAVQDAVSRGIDLCPVWNKSNREHTIVGTKPGSLREEADAAVRALGWTGDYFVDADHINLHTVDGFLACSDFFTLDVADCAGQAPGEAAKASFLAKHSGLVGSHRLPGWDGEVVIAATDLERTADKFLGAMLEAGRIYRYIAENKTNGAFAVEVSVDETDSPQTPAELLIILAMIADEGIPAQTIAPKFTGRFNKGVDYVGDLAAFEREFDADLAVLAYAVAKFSLPAGLKISVHSGSDKFSLYPVIRRLVAKHSAGLHLKTAGTTWLEEVAGLAEADGDGLEMAKDIYARARGRADELIRPYAPVVDIDVDRLPPVNEVRSWNAARFLGCLVHNQSCPDYDPQFRQFIHVAFKVAAEIGEPYHRALSAHRAVVARRVRENLLQSHILPLFG